VNNLREAAVLAAKVGVDLLIEPINTTRHSALLFEPAGPRA
jgi:hydroxypyruvate isomerase